MCKFAIFFLFITLFILCKFFFLFCVCFTCNNKKKGTPILLTLLAWVVSVELMRSGMDRKGERGYLSENYRLNLGKSMGKQGLMRITTPDFSVLSLRLISFLAAVWSRHGLEFRSSGSAWTAEPSYQLQADYVQRWGPQGKPWCACSRGFQGTLKSPFFSCQPVSKLSF